MVADALGFSNKRKTFGNESTLRGVQFSTPAVRPWPLSPLDLGRPEGTLSERHSFKLSARNEGPMHAQNQRRHRTCAQGNGLSGAIQCALYCAYTAALGRGGRTSRF